MAKVEIVWIVIILHGAKIKQDEFLTPVLTGGMIMSALQRILYVEDNADIREVVRLALEDLGGYTLAMCESGKDALTIIDDFCPDLVLLDVMMPGMDGPETLKAMRDQHSVEGLPVVFMTAKAHPEELARYLEMGVSEVIAKPFDPMTLPSKIEAIWERFYG